MDLEERVKRLESENKQLERQVYLAQLEKEWWKKHCEAGTIKIELLMDENARLKGELEKCGT